MITHKIPDQCRYAYSHLGVVATPIGWVAEIYVPPAPPYTHIRSVLIDNHQIRTVCDLPFSINLNRRGPQYVTFGSDLLMIDHPKVFLTNDGNTTTDESLALRFDYDKEELEVQILQYPDHKPEQIIRSLLGIPEKPFIAYMHENQVRTFVFDEEIKAAAFSHDGLSIIVVKEKEFCILDAY